MKFARECQIKHLCHGLPVASMSSLIYEAVFTSYRSDSPIEPARLPTSGPPKAPEQAEDRAESGFAAFICRVAYLEDKLRRGEKSRFFDASSDTKIVARHQIGNGASFHVDRVEIRRKDHADGGYTHPQSKDFVAIKTIKERPQVTPFERPIVQPNSNQRSQWQDILLEIRALLHEPLRYHPNIVRLLEIGWGSSHETGSPFPALVLEFAEFGTLDHLQRTEPGPLPFRVKQKLCYDVGRGLSILHACGIVHGDLKHENVLIFRNQYDDPPLQPYTAELADFGGAVIDIQKGHTIMLPMGTAPFEAPESKNRLTFGEVKKTDTYSYGMLVWRCFVDCQDLLYVVGIRNAPGPSKLSSAEEKQVDQLKNSDEILKKAIQTTQSLSPAPTEVLMMLDNVLMSTMRTDPSQRTLGRAQALLRGMPADAAKDYSVMVEAANQKLAEQAKIPGQHGMDLDSVGYGLGRLGDDYDAQNNLPGYRPDLPYPASGGSIFEPSKLKRILTWTQQEECVKELERSTQVQYTEDTDAIEPWNAAFYLFEAHLAGFGLQLDPQKACHWLHMASTASDTTASHNYLAAAWLSRTYDAFGVPNPLNLDDQIEMLGLSIMRGHRHCMLDATRTLSKYTNTNKQTEAFRMINNYTSFFRILTGGVGMPHYVDRNLRRPYDLRDLTDLDKQIKAELGSDYEACLRTFSDTMDEEPPEDGHKFDKIYVNQKGHGLLHMAATFGNINALTHLYHKYRCDIDVPNRSMSESPLVCACRSGNYSCALFLLDKGAVANGTKFGEEAPLHWVSSFMEPQMRVLTQRLIATGADTERHTGTMRKDVRGINADWEGTFGLPLTALGRAVLMQNIAAVRVLLEVTNADPLNSGTVKDIKIVSAIELASIMTLPDILQVLLEAVDAKQYDESVSIYDECAMLEAAHDMKHTRTLTQPFDTLSLQSRVVRHGGQHKDCLARTLMILHCRRLKSHERGADHVEVASIGKTLCREVSLGNADIVEVLLNLGHSADGSAGFHPLEEAVKVNNLSIFRMLIERGATIDAGIATSLLIGVAKKPETSPSGIVIAQHLIEEGARIDDPPHSQPSALAYAVQKRYFDLADLLLSYDAGHSLNTIFEWEGQNEPVSLLGLLLQSHTFNTQQSIAYLAKKHNDGTCSISLQPVCTSDSLTALHILALFDPENFNNRAQVSARIIQHILDIFPSPHSLGNQLIHPEHGTPLTAAIQKLNEPVISALLESDHRADLLTLVALQQVSRSGQNTSTLLLPSRLAGLQLLDRVEQLENAASITVADIQDLLNRQELSVMVNLYTRAELQRLAEKSNATATKDTASAASTSPVSTIIAQQSSLLLTSALSDRTTALKKRQCQSLSPQSQRPLEAHTSSLSLHSTSDDYFAPSPTRPLIEDLSVLTEEKPTGWVEGVEMDQEIALRTFLMYMRNGMLANSIHRFMDERYNRRRDELKAEKMRDREVEEDGGKDV